MKKLFIVIMCIPSIVFAQTIIPNCERPMVIRYTYNGWNDYDVHGPKGNACEEIGTKYNQVIVDIDLKSCAELASEKKMTCYQLGNLYTSGSFDGHKCFGCY